MDIQTWQARTDVPTNIYASFLLDERHLESHLYKKDKPV